MKIKNVKSVELSFATNENKKYFVNEPDLVGRKITGISTFNAAQSSKTLKGNTTVSEEDSKKAFITLVPEITGANNIELPLYALNPAYSQGNVQEFDFGAINLQKSFIEFTDEKRASTVPIFIYFE